jgi:predicted nucleic acid-binding protein
MDALVDTSVWSLALRRKPEHLSSLERSVVAELANLAHEGRVRLIGVVRQELLSGVKSTTQYEKLRLHLRAFLDEPIETQDYEGAARITNSCMSRGIVAPVVDALICEVARARGWSVFSTDRDFEGYAQVVPITLHGPRPKRTRHG